MKERFKNIDFLKFVFAVMVVMFHLRLNPLVVTEINQLIPGIFHFNVCVDFFFIIAGFFMFFKIDTTESVFNFAQKRFLRLAPLLWLFVFLQLVLSLIIHTSFSLDGNILKLFLLHNIGFTPNTGGEGSVVTWFISSLFWVSVFYFYLAKIIDKNYFNFIIWITTICSLGLFLNYNNFNTGGNTSNIFFFINIGILRGLYGMGIGYFISLIYKNKFLQTTCSKLTTTIISAVEIFCIGFLGYYLFFTKTLPGKSGFLYMLIFSIIFYLFLIRKGLISKLLNNNLSVILGKYSYSIYVMQMLIFVIFNKLIWVKSNTFVMNNLKMVYCMEVLCAILFGALIYYIFEKPINKLISTKLAKNKVS